MHQAHDMAWSVAEQNSTEYGVRRADAKFQRSAHERNWFWATELFRWIMRNRGKAITVLRVYIFPFHHLLHHMYISPFHHLLHHTIQTL